MHAEINSTQTRALAAFVNTIRPDWDIPGIAAALHRARHRAPADEVAIALIRLTTRDDLRTPAVLADDGAHWQGLATAQARAPQRPKCQAHGVATRVTDGRCPLCHAEAKAIPDDQRDRPTLGLTPDQAATNERGIRQVRAAMRRTR